MTRVALRKAGIAPGLLSCPVEIHFFFDDGLDVDNHAVIGKAVVDALKGYLLRDDAKKWFHKVSYEFWDGGSILVEIIPLGPNQTRKETTT